MNQSKERLAALKTLTISDNIKDAQFIMILVDYNPYSKLLELERLKDLCFYKQIRIFHSGFATWQVNLRAL